MAGSAKTSSNEVPIASPCCAAKSRASSGSSVTPREKRIRREACTAWTSRWPHQPSPMIAALSIALRLSSERCRRSRLLERMGAREGVDLLARVGDAHEIRERRGVDVEELRAGRLAGDADVRERHLVAVRELAGLLALEVRLEPGERLGVPVPAPRR